MDYTISNYILNNIRITLNVLNKYDPMGLATLVGSNEYEVEAIDIGVKAGAITSKYLAECIRESFYFWFSIKIDKEICQKIARDINNGIVNGKLLK